MVFIDALENRSGRSHRPIRSVKPPRHPLLHIIQWNGGYALENLHFADDSLANS